MWLEDFGVEVPCRLMFEGNDGNISEVTALVASVDVKLKRR